MRHPRILLYSVVSLACVCACDRHPLVTVAPAIRFRICDVDTKAVPMTTTGLEQSGEFFLDAFLDDEYYDFVADPNKEHPLTERHYINGGSWFSAGPNVTYSSTAGWTIGGAPTWVAGDMMRFWCYAPISVNGTRTLVTGPVSKGETVKFSYAMPTPNGSTDADICDDPIFAYNEKNYSKAAGDAIDLTFHHALAQVRFCVGYEDGSFDTGLKIKSVALVGIPASGTAVFNGPASLSQSGTDPIFSWSGQTGQVTFNQVLDAVFLKKGEVAVPAGWTEDKTGKTYTCDNTFFVVPHTLAPSVSSTPANSVDALKIVFVDGANEYPVTVAIPVHPANFDPSDSSAGKWLAGKYYTYKIGATILGRTIKATVSLMDWNDFDDKLFGQ